MRQCARIPGLRRGRSRRDLTRCVRTVLRFSLERFLLMILLFFDVPTAKMHWHFSSYQRIFDQGKTCNVNAKFQGNEESSVTWLYRPYYYPHMSLGYDQATSDRLRSDESYRCPKIETRCKSSCRNSKFVVQNKQYAALIYWYRSIITYLRNWSEKSNLIAADWLRFT